MRPGHASAAAGMRAAPAIGRSVGLSHTDAVLTGEAHRDGDG